MKTCFVAIFVASTLFVLQNVEFTTSKGFRKSSVNIQGKIFCPTKFNECLTKVLRKPYYHTKSSCEREVYRKYFCRPQDIALRDRSMAGDDWIPFYEPENETVESEFKGNETFESEFKENETFESEPDIIVRDNVIKA